MAETGYTTVSTLETPTSVAFASSYVGQGEGFNQEYKRKYVIKENLAASKQAYISFVCKHYTFQVIWMYRRRKSPTLLESEGKDRAREEWTDWSEIEGSATEKAKTKRKSYGESGYHTTTTPISFNVSATAYQDSYKDYDAWEFAIGVRTVDEEPRQVSAWSTDLYECKQKGTNPQGTVKVVYAPYIEWGNLLRKNGELYIQFKAHWERDNNKIRMQRSVGNGGEKTCDWANVNASDTQTTAISKYMYTDITDAATELPIHAYGFLCWKTSDDIAFTDCRKIYYETSIPIDSEEIQSEDVQIPTVQVSYYEDFGLLGVEVLDITNLTNISATLSFTNSAGNVIATDYLTGSQSPCYKGNMGTLKKYMWYDYPIFDEPMVLNVSLSNGTKYSVGEFTITIHSYSMVWNNGDCSELVQAPYNIGLDEDLDFDTDSIKTALGTRPVMRYGTGGERTIKASCATVRQSTVASKQTVSTPSATVTVYDHQTKETTITKASPQTPWTTTGGVRPSSSTTANRIVERLKQPHDWVFRAPHGVWYNVAVTAVNRSWDYSTQLDTVDVTMQEVDDGS